MTDGPAHETFADWSPDGKRIAFARIFSLETFEAAIYTLRVNGGRERRLTPPGLSSLTPNWSPDGDRIVFNTFCITCASNDVYVIDANGAHLTQLTQNFGHAGNPAWSPDGEHIIFDHYETIDFYPGTLVVMDANGDHVRTVLDSPGDDWGGSWQPIND